MLFRSLELPVYGLDQIVWQPGWTITPRELQLTELLNLTSKSDWIIEGVSNVVQEQADIVIFLDVPRRISYFRCAKRNWKYLFSSRPGLPHNCPEIRIIPYLVRLIWNFPRKVRPQILLSMDKSADRSYIIRSANDLNTALRELEFLT